MVTQLGRVSEAGSRVVGRRWGVAGNGGSKSIFMAASLRSSGVEMRLMGELVEESSVSTDRLRDPLASDVRRRFREQRSLSSSNGLGRVEHGSDETARSIDGSVDGERDICIVWFGNVGNAAVSPQTGELRSGKLGGSFLISQLLACGGVL